MVELETFLAGINSNRDGSDCANSLLHLLFITLWNVNESNIPCTLLTRIIVAFIVDTLVGITILSVDTWNLKGQS